MTGKRPILAFVLILLAAGLACSIPGRTAPTPTPILAATMDPKILEGQMATSIAKFNETGQLDIAFTEQQVTSYVAQEIAKQPDTPITEPQISLQNGQIILTGKFKVGILTTEASMVFEPYVLDGKLQVTFVSAKFGSVPIPDVLLKQITQAANDNLSQYITVDGQSVEIQSVRIDAGRLELTGKAR